MRIMNVSVCTILVWLSLICCPSVADAGLQEDQGSGFTITPRLWLSSVDPIVGVTAVKETYLVPSYGATLSYRPNGTSNYTFLLSGLWGEGDGDAKIPGGSLETTVNGVPFSMSSTASLGKSEGKRTDMEFLIRRGFPDKSFSLLFGLRYATWRETTTSNVGYAISVGPIFGQTFSDEQVAKLAADIESDYYGLEIGFGMVSQISQDGHHNLVTDFIIAGAYTKWKTSVEVSQSLVPESTFLDFLDLPDSEVSGNHLATGLDVAAGYQYRSNRFGCSLRYKILVLLEENALELPELTAISGPEIGISIIF